MSKKIVVLDNGHGGVIGGIYQTPIKQSPEWDKGILYEGAYNRWITSLIIRELDYSKIPYYHISPEFADISLKLRTDRVNDIYLKNKNIYLLSIHGNLGGGNGIEGYTTKGETESDSICNLFLKDIEENFSSLSMRFDRASDDDSDKEADFYILRKSKCPAVLLELLFMDNKKNYDLMFDRPFQQKMALTIAGTIKRLYLN